ncbi:hypothetical protein LTR94_034722, partial [Friedmanniomyces endolithicus]
GRAAKDGLSAQDLLERRADSRGRGRRSDARMGARPPDGSRSDAGGIPRILAGFPAQAAIGL